MSYIKIKNPIDVEVKTGWKGEYHLIPAGETKSYPEELVLQFKEVYPFLQIVSEEEVAEPEIKTSELKVKTKKK